MTPQPLTALSPGRLFVFLVVGILLLVQVGRAVALRLGLDGFDVVCCTASDERFASLQRELVLLQQKQHQEQQLQPHHHHLRHQPGELLRANRVDEGVHYRLWVVGKFDPSVR